MKILIVSDMTGGPGGAYKYITQIEDFFSKKHIITILLEENTKEYVHKNYFFKKSFLKKISPRYHNEVSIIQDFKSMLSSENPDIVHFVNGSIKSNRILRKYLIENKIPFIVTEQFIDSSLVLDRDLLAEVQYINTHTTQTIYVSHSNKNIAEHTFYVKSKKSSVIYNAIAMQNLHEERDRNKSTNKMYTVARCIPQKGIDTVLRAMALLPEYDLQFAVYGDGDNAEEYRKLAKSILPKNHIFHILGWSSHIDIEKISQKHDLFISASRQEGLSYSLLESASVQMPMISSTASGSFELVKLTNCGDIFEIDDHIALAYYIKKFQENPQSLISKAINSKEVFASLFDIDTNMNFLETIYNSITT